jgi:hypothetical protein
VRLCPLRSCPPHEAMSRWANSHPGLTPNSPVALAPGYVFSYSHLPLSIASDWPPSAGPRGRLLVGCPSPSFFPRIVKLQVSAVAVCTWATRKRRPTEGHVHNLCPACTALSPSASSSACDSQAPGEDTVRHKSDREAMLARASRFRRRRFSRQIRLSQSQSHPIYPCPQSLIESGATSITLFAEMFGMTVARI